LETKEFDLMFRDEQTHWWYKARRRIVEFYLAQGFASRQGCTILDIASACGANLDYYKKYGTVCGVDISETSINYCKKRGITNVLKADAHHLPFGESSFDIVLALDALEHFSDDRRVLAEIYRVLRQNGTLIVSSPAFNLLWSQHDEAFHHVRRYTRRELKDKLASAGFSVVYATYWSCLLFFPVFFLRRGRDLLRQLMKSKRQPVSDFGMTIPPVIMKLLDGLAQGEAFFIKRRVTFPLGVSVFSVARKSEGV
jgi:ubiquinone/menaquinone biosynthesis C-methylase UbiE